MHSRDGHLIGLIEWEASDPGPIQSHGSNTRKTTYSKAIQMPKEQLQRSQTLPQQGRPLSMWCFRSLVGLIGSRGPFRLRQVLRRIPPNRQQLQPWCPCVHSARAAASWIITLTGTSRSTCLFPTSICLLASGQMCLGDPRCRFSSHTHIVLPTAHLVSYGGYLVSILWRMRAALRALQAWL